MLSQPDQLRNRLYIALALYAALGTAVWLTVSDQSAIWGWQGSQFTPRRLALAVLAVFVVRTMLYFRSEELRTKRERLEQESSGLM